MSSRKYKQEFEALLVKNSWWKRLIGSQFVDMFTVFVSQLITMAENACRRFLQETFLSTATKRASILAAAEDKGFIGRRVSPSTGEISIKNKTGNVVAVPKDSVLISTASRQYVTVNSIKLAPNATINTWISQLVLKKFTVNVAEEVKFLEVLLPKSVTAITHRVDVYVTTRSGALQLWEKRYMFRRATSSSQVYTEFYKPSEQLGIRFGNGINGKIPSQGSTIVLKVWTTDGDTTLIDNQKLEIVGDMVYINDKLDIKTITPITGGAASASDNEIRSGALYVTSYDEQIVWDDDYPFFIKQNIANLLWCRAWGEQEQEDETGLVDLDNINRIFVSGFSSKQEQAQLSKSIIDLLVSTKYLNKRYCYVEANDRPFTIELVGTVTGAHDLVQVEKVVKDAINEVYGRIPTKDRTDLILEKDVNNLVDELELFHDFSIKWNFPKNIKLNDYIYIDAEQSVFKINYWDEL